MNIYVGNIPYGTTESEIRELFEEYGKVDSVKLIKDMATDRLKGFGFVEMSQNAGMAAIENLNEYDLNDRQLVVNEARERSNNRNGSSYNRKRY